MKTDTDLIAEFLGAKIKQLEFAGQIHKTYKFPDQPFAKYEYEVEYHKDWNLLMRVIQIIDVMCPKIIMPDDLPKLKNGTHGSERFTDVTALPISVSIEEAHAAVVKFIKWYNKK